MRILIFGDSITQGYWDAYGGWVQRLAHEYHQQSLASMLEGGHNRVTLFNLGISGDTADDIANRIEPEIKARMGRQQDTIVLLAVGINDAPLRDNRALMDVYGFQETYEKCINQAQKQGAKVICVGLSAVDEQKTDPWPYSDRHNQWHNARINAFEDTIKQSAGRKDVPFVPIHDQFLAALEAGQELLSDGLHPNEAGHQLIAELIKPALNDLIAS